MSLRNNIHTQRARLAYADAYLHGDLPNALREPTTAEIFEARAKAGRMTPLEVILAAMDAMVDEVNATAEKLGAARTGKARATLKAELGATVLRAVSVAKEAAPYIHRKQPLAVETRDLTAEDAAAQAQTVRDVGAVLLQHARSTKALGAATDVQQICD